MQSGSMVLKPSVPITISYFGIPRTGQRLTCGKLYVRVGRLVVSTASLAEDTPQNTASAILTAILAYLDFMDFVRSRLSRCIPKGFIIRKSLLNYEKKYSRNDLLTNCDLIIEKMAKLNRLFYPCRLSLEYSREYHTFLPSLIERNAQFIEYYNQSQKSIIQ